MRLLISDLLSEDQSLEVIGTAVNGKEAAAKSKQHKPDLLVLDMNMGEYDGMYAVKRIMKENPLPILILSAQGNTDLAPIFDALQQGAVDYMNKPSRGGSKMRMLHEELIRKVKSVARAKPRAINKEILKLKNGKPVLKTDHKYDIIAIGASTGGPTAIEEVVSSLPSDLNVPVIICQHMPANFIRPFVDRLNGNSPLQIVMGERGIVPRPGLVIICPGHSNTVIEEDDKGEPKISFTSEVFREYNNPSINALMLSIATHYGPRAMGVILTGMGKDGVKGLAAIKEKGGYTVSQDKESSVLYGMPKAAIESGASLKAISLKDMSRHLMSRL